MVGGFDALINDLHLMHRVRSADPGLLDRVAATRDDAPPHHLREAIAGSGKSQEAARQAALPRARVVETAPSRNLSAHSAADMAAAGQELDQVMKAVQVDSQLLKSTSARRLTRSERIAHVRAQGQEILEKAMTGFNAGEITADQVCQLEILVGNTVRAHVDWVDA